MKTLLLTEIFPPKSGGSGRWFCGVYGLLPRDQYLLAVGTDPAQGAFDDSNDLRVRRLNLHSDHWELRSIAALLYYTRIVRQVRRIAAEESITRLHCARCLPEGWTAWLLKHWMGLPYDCYVHGEDAGTAATSRELTWMVHRVFDGADRLISNSYYTASLLREVWHVPDEKIRVMHPGVSADRLVPADRNLRERQRLGWGDRPVVLTVGRLQKRKGHDMLIRALPAIRKSFRNVLYAIVGSGEEEGPLRRSVEELGLRDHVQFLGEIDDDTLIRCYQQCDLFVLPNRTLGGDIEGFGIVLLEAQSCGHPVVAGASGGTAETMRIGDTGLVVNCDGPSPLDETIVQLLSDSAERERMGRAAREWIVDEFDWSRLARRMEEVLGAGPLIEGPSVDESKRRLPTTKSVVTASPLAHDHHVTMEIERAWEEH
jgi:phosphatidyl-myo-inositol dimannoside synthase